ncbi:UDP-glucose 4-epimerase GalE [Candidatus Roizmanbacteria bacterium RIFCSPHIGHO2_01_FULL_39_12c]|uniref:UDP-glucose 4-epimerase n=1 Tax=Candidatus Roizmanbacteria bacterium RIFCSPHIGHO2_01_FULL_39_12c TaxID=1802031 RepID=A0A1F7GF47_9BACT|nr:MAG: UDP-glucose 4-epimerase GalE [Candidatus Roizmanbacteria bacterium RIFCSPHIGHO2_01_FULL_39_12c]
MSKILITGAGGYIGSVATYLFLQQGYEVVVIDNFATGYKQPLELLQTKFGFEKLRFYEADLTADLSPIFEEEKNITATIHYAATCSVDESMKKPGKYFRNNVLGTLNLLDGLVKNSIKNFIFSSTCAVYGEAEYVPVDEKHPTNPSNPYGESKLMAERIIQWYGKLHDIKYAILRYFNVAGASDDGLIGDSKKPSSLLTQNAVRGALGIEPFFLTCVTVDTPDKTPIRDYINVVDLNEAHLKAVEYLNQGGKSEIFNLGTGTGNSVLEIVRTVEQVTGKQMKLKNTTPRQGEYAKMIASIAKAEKLLNWKPEREIEDSIRSLSAWYKNNPQGWK